MMDFEYDAAFSFHQADEGLAQQLNDLLADRFRTFIYTERQVDLAGKDGEIAFGSVYSEKARVVIVFSRKEWGQTAFTRIEETAIRNRAYREGYDFTLFIPTDDPPFVPQWLPKTQLWFGLKRFGLDGAAAVVEQKIQAAGGELRVESVGERAARAKRTQEFTAERSRFLQSDDGVQHATKAYHEVLAAIRGGTEEAKQHSGLPLAILEKDEQMVLHGLNGCVHVRFPRQYTNVLEGYPVIVDFLDGAPRVYWLASFDEPRKWATDRFQFTLLGPDRHGFQDVDHLTREFEAADLAAHILHRYFDLSEKNPRHR